MKPYLAFILGLILMFTGMDVAAQAKSQQQAITRVACVGDSITEGLGTDPGRSYPEQLQKLLGDRWEVGNFGISARTLLRKGDLPYWNESIFRKAQAFQPNIVIIMLGTNDTKPNNWVHSSDFAADYTALVKTFLDLPSQPTVYICKPIPAPEPNERIIQQQIRILKKLATELPVKLLDMHSALEPYPELIPDDIHPNSAGAAVLAATAARAITAR